MRLPLRVLLVEDCEDDALLLVRELRRADYEPISERVDTPEAMRQALARDTWDIVLTDQAMPHFSAADALEVLKASGQEIPLILVSGNIKTEDAVRLLQAGVRDFINKSDLSRLIPAIDRELRESQSHRTSKQVQEQLRLLSTAVATTANAIFITDQKGMILD